MFFFALQVKNLCSHPSRSCKSLYEGRGEQAQLTKVMLALFYNFHTNMRVTFFDIELLFLVTSVVWGSCSLLIKQMRSSMQACMLNIFVIVPHWLMPLWGLLWNPFRGSWQDKGIYVIAMFCPAHPIQTDLSCLYEIDIIASWIRHHSS